MAQNERRYDLDWLRVGAFSILILFHTGMMFNTWEWHVKNNQTTMLPEYFMTFLHQWRMPLLFFISGAAIWFALDRYSPARFIRERITRLLLPLIAGMLLVIPPQVYFERLFQGVHYDSFGDFYRTVLDFVPYPEGNFSWHHLWYLPYILVYSLLSLPLFYWCKSAAGTEKLQRLVAQFERGGTIILWFIPIAIGEMILRQFWRGDTHDLVSDWSLFTSMFLIFLYGFFLASSPGIWPAIERIRYRTLTLGIACMPALYWAWYSDYLIAAPAEVALFRFVRILNLWCWILAILGFGYKYLRKNPPALRRANEAVYPFYIFHQTVTVILGYYLAGWNIPVLAKFLVVAAGTIIGSWILYELVRRSNVTRVLFGMKPRSVAPQELRLDKRFLCWGSE